MSKTEWQYVLTVVSQRNHFLPLKFRVVGIFSVLISDCMACTVLSSEKCI